MATAAPSPLASSVEKTNGAKLSRLLIDGGTTVLRNAFDNYHSPANLAADLIANYPTLNKLLKKKVLRTAQWDKLFPPGGATPDSNTFDITLLFLLLTNICGLSPPPSGWHVKPLPSDTSPEANLARIKFFRNELYGHVSTTGIDTPTFTALWQEISVVLVSLGLDQVEIDTLQAEHCGEEVNLGLLLDWAESEEDIKSQLKDIRQCQTETQQDVEKIHKTQLEDRKTLEDSKSTLEKVHQIQIETHQAIKEACQTQLEDHKTLEDSKSRLEEVHQSQIETHQATKEAHQTQLEMLKQLKQTAEEQREKKGDDEILKKLAKVDTERDIKYHTGRYQEGTRASFVRKVEDWLDDSSSQNRVMVISGNAGMGKSVISAVVCKRMQEAGKLSGSHFCQHDKARHRNPKVMLQSLACQLSDSLPEYKNRLVDKLSRNLGVELKDMEVKELFELLFEEPLSKLTEDPGRNILMVIDGLDESEYKGRNELLDVIANHFGKLPYWIRFLVTTRPEINIAESLESFNPLHLEPNDEENLQDIKLLFEKRLSHAIQSESQEVIITKLVEKSEGLILYAHLLVDFIKKNIGEKVSSLTPEQLDSTLPSGISSVYRTYFQRLEAELCKELKIGKEQFMIFLSALAAAREPLLLGFVTEILLSGSRSLADRQKVKDGIACISALLPVRDECIHFFHKSVKDWLTDKSCYGQRDLTVDEKEGHYTLSKLCTGELDDVKRKSIANSKFSDTAKYALQHGVVHMLELGEDKRACNLEEVVKKYVIDLELVYAKLHVNNASAAEDIVRLQKQEISPVLSEESEIQLNTLLFLLRKYHNLFTNHPGVFFQTLLNERGTVLPAEASKLLQDKYSEITYMEYLDKEGHEPAPQAQFPCPSPVTFFDVSPQLDYMVCECKDGTIRLWSLHTGKLEWVRPVKVTKHYSDYGHATCRTSPSSPVLSCYRSVVFHPTKDVVLPGILSHAYAIDGELKPLFPQSCCSFTVCSILNSGDENMILTNCLDDAKCIIMWSLEDGSEVARISRDEDVLSFACSRNGEMLAISHSTGSICLLDVKNHFRTLAQASTQEVCGMIKFSPDHKFLFGWHVPRRDGDSCGFCLIVRRILCDTFLLDVLADRNVSYNPMEYELCSEAGFLSGDPLSCVFEDSIFSDDFSRLGWECVFVLSSQSVLRCTPGNSSIAMFSPNKLKCLKRRSPSDSEKENIAFSLNGETVYVGVAVPFRGILTVTALDVSSGKRKAKITFQSAGSKLFVPVKEGVLFVTLRIGPLELWNFELSQCVCRWSNLCEITEMIRISEEQVACVEEGNKVNILDTTSRNIVTTIQSTIQTLGREAITCNSRYQLLCTDRDSLQLSDGTYIRWKKPWFNSLLCVNCLPGMFSPTEEFVVISAKTVDGDQGVYVLDALSGKTLHTLCRGTDFFGCEFIGDEECVIGSQDHDVSKGSLIRLFNVKSGDLLSVIVRQKSTVRLATCPVKHLIAIDINNDPERDFKLEWIQVKMPRFEDNRKNKRITKRPQIKDGCEKKRCLLM